MRVISITLAVLTIACSFASVDAADPSYSQRYNHIRRELLERKQILEESLAHGANDADTRFYLADCELALLDYQGAADNYAYALVMGASGNQARRCREQLEKLGRLGFRPNFDPGPSGSAGAAAQPSSRGSGKIQSHHDQLATQLKEHAQRAADQKRAYFNRAISDIERRLQEDIRHLPKSYTDGRQTVRADNTAEINDLTRVARDRQDKLRYQLEKSLEGIERDKQRKLEGLQYSASSLQAQTQTTSGAVGLVPSGTSMHVRNYINFPDAAESDRYAPPTVPVRATPGKWNKKP